MRCYPLPWDRLLAAFMVFLSRLARIEPLFCHLAAHNPTSYGRSIEFLSNILALDKKTDRTAVLLKQGWLTYKKGGYRVLRENADRVRA